MERGEVIGAMESIHHQNRNDVLTVTDKWIQDIASSHDPDISRSDDFADIGIATEIYLACVDLLSTLFQAVKVKHSHARNHPDLVTMRESLTRLYLWGEGMDGGRLELCLEYDEDLRNIVIEQLKIIARWINTALSSPELRKFCPLSTISTRKGQLESLLEKAELLPSAQENDNEDLSPVDSDDEESGCEVGNLAKKLKSPLRNLMDLTPLLERAFAQTLRPVQARLFTDIEPKFCVSEPAKHHVNLVRERYRQASEILVERLGEANWQRFVRIRRQMQDIENIPESAAAFEPTIDVQSRFVPASKFYDSGLGTSLARRSSMAASIASQSSFLTTSTDTSGAFRVPATPVEVLERKPFVCFICGTKLHHIRNRADWKKHVFVDLQPYICTIGDCRESLTTFSTRQAWRDHEFSYHRCIASLKCYCNRVYYDTDGFINHLRTDHGYHRDSVEHLEKISTTRRTLLPKEIQNEECPLCCRANWTTQHTFVTHVSRHMENIALGCLPREVESDAEDGSVVSEENLRPNEPSLVDHSTSLSGQDEERLTLPPIEFLLEINNPDYVDVEQLPTLAPFRQPRKERLYNPLRWD